MSRRALASRASNLLHRTAVLCGRGLGCQDWRSGLQSLSSNRVAALRTRLHPGPLQAGRVRLWVPFARERERGVGQCNVRKRLREVAQHTPVLRIVLLAEQTNIIGEREKLLEEVCGFLLAADKPQAGDRT